MLFEVVVTDYVGGPGDSYEESTYEVKADLPVLVDSDGTVVLAFEDKDKKLVAAFRNWNHGGREGSIRLVSKVPITGSGKASADAVRDSLDAGAGDVDQKL